MTYREDVDAARARAEALEKELASARAEIDELKGARSEALVRAGSQALEKHAAVRWLGGPTRLALSRTIEGELPEEAYADLVGRSGMILGQIGNVTALKGLLSWSSTLSSGLVINVVVTSRDQKTTIRIKESLSRLAGGIFGGVGGGVGGGGMMLPVLAAHAVPVLTPLAIAAWLGGVFALCRRLYSSIARRHSENLFDLLEQLVEADSGRVTR